MCRGFAAVVESWGGKGGIGDCQKDSAVDARELLAGQFGELVFSMYHCLLQNWCQ